jgi:hypothetical protein
MSGFAWRSSISAGRAGRCAGPGPQWKHLEGPSSPRPCRVRVVSRDSCAVCACACVLACVRARVCVCACVRARARECKGGLGGRRLRGYAAVAGLRLCTHRRLH